MADKNFIVKNGLEVGGQEVVSSSGVVTSAALGGQTLASTDSPTFNNLTLTNDIAVGGDINLTGDLNITGDVNSLSVTDLDVTDQTITLGAGQVESASGGSGIIVDGSNASILWDETNTEFDINNPLHITTAALTTAYFTAQETSGATTSLRAGGSVGYVGTYSNHPFRIVTNTGTKIYVGTDGKIGIGSNHTNPLQTVDISGSAAGLNLQGGNNRIYFSNYRALEGATDASLLQVGEGFTDIALQGNVGIGDTSPAAKLEIKQGSSNWYEGIRINRSDNTTQFGTFSNNSGATFIGAADTAGGNNNAILFGNSTNGTTFTERMRITSSGNLKFVSQTTNFESPAFTYHTNNYLYLRGGSAGLILSDDSGINTVQIIDGSAGYINFETGDGSSRMRIKSDGNVGIGTINPDYALDVYDIGEAWIRADSSHTTESTANSGLRFAHGGVNHGVLYHRGSDDALLYFDNIAADTRFLLDSSGKFGIGTDNPTRRLHVNSSTDNMVARFQSTDSTGGIELMDSAGSVELEAVGEVFNVHPGGLGTRTFTSSVDNHLFLTTYAHGDTSTHFDAQFLNTGTANRGPRVRIRGGGQSSGVSAAVPWDSQQGYDIGSLWFDSSEGPSIFGTGIAATAESDWNANDTPSALAFYTTPDQTGAQTNTAKERLRLRADGTAHFSPSESDTRIYIGSSGGLTGGNSSNWVRGSGSTLMYNCGGGSASHIWETAGTQRLQLTNAYLEQKTDQVDQYTLRSRNTASGDPGLSLTRDNVVGFGIAVRGAADDYVDFQVNSAGATSFGETGKLRLYHNGNVSIPGTALWSTGVGNTFGTTGNHYMVRTSSSTGNETIIINNTQAGSVGVLQYRESGGVRGSYFVADTSNGIYSTSGSDYRFKENVATITDDYLTKLTSLRPITYTHSADYDDDTSTTHTGFIAHEVEEIFPEFVDGEKDAVWTQEELDARGDPDTINETVGDAKYQTIAYERKEWNVYIVRALQQLKAENEALKSRIEALEG